MLIPLDPTSLLNWLLGNKEPTITISSLTPPIPLSAPEVGFLLPPFLELLYQSSLLISMAKSRIFFNPHLHQSPQCLFNSAGHFLFISFPCLGSWLSWLFPFCSFWPSVPLPASWMSLFFRTLSLTLFSSYSTCCSCDYHFYALNFYFQRRPLLNCRYLLGLCPYGTQVLNFQIQSSFFPNLFLFWFPTCDISKV